MFSVSYLYSLIKRTRASFRFFLVVVMNLLLSAAFSGCFFSCKKHFALPLNCLSVLMIAIFNQCQHRSWPQKLKYLRLFKYFIFSLQYLWLYFDVRQSEILLHSTRMQRIKYLEECSKFSKEKLQCFRVMGDIVDTDRKLYKRRKREGGRSSH